ncbi:MAG: UDP-glucose:(heptosyl)LPS alpha-1,3-glucosyltransferase [Kiritimatiellia bacterium]|jgi:UDP-glucose:(heptosyl)LPS alpha-1,3-glucosyltransferase
MTHSIHIVRRYGLVGGMENYVVNLTNALASAGQRVTVICEVNECFGIDNVQFESAIEWVELGNTYRKPRWLAQWGFSQRVSEYIAKGLHKGAIIHSHERTADHHVTTFHGPPFLMRKRRLLDFLSPRIHMWTYLEKQELLGEQVLAILPNSPLIGGQLKSLYPSIADKVLAPAYPGVAANLSSIKRRSDGFTVGFLGKEWKRKGLDVASQIVVALRQRLPQIHFVVAGCDPLAIQHLFNDWPDGSYTLAGWLDDPESFLGKIDLLLHPARAEPFGMAIAEANAAGIPVIVSEHCGVAALIGEAQGSVCELDVQKPNIMPWVDACMARLSQPRAVTSFNLSWGALAEQHILLYQSLRLV